ncbi:kinase-like domain-containing protein [Gigaspora rosea]|uniref:Kinase-like domain-containing protein n=1 Tax=Gigaspora rosea TaxID=44941 RepID=A0A397TY10_9GLOM|nr:kinase-like domain-containing protein [Gigaspora rosea]
MRNSFYGKCQNCKQYNTFYAWYQLCDPKITVKGWTSTSRNDVIDKCIKGFQRKAIMYDDVIEWIPFDRLKDVKYIATGGFGSVFSAIWLDGMRVTEHLSECLKEFENHMQCKLMGSELMIYGLTKSTNNDNKLGPKADDYLMVLQFADSGNLYNGNILQNKIDSTAIRSYIADLGLSKKIEDHIPTGTLFGVMPYVAPEVLSDKNYTTAADVYGLGIIMAEMSTGQRHCDGLQFDNNLTFKIIDGLRPEFAPGTPVCYVKLAEKCMDQDLQKRPTANEISLKLFRLWGLLYYSDMSDNKLHIKEKFLDADKKIKELPNIIRKHPDSMYTSKPINTKELSIGIYLH